MRITVLAGLVAATVAAGCGDSGDSGGGGASAFAAGVAVKGPIDGATVTVFALRPTGALGGVLASGTTDATGAFDIGVNGYTGWAAVRVTGGSFADEATGAAATIPDDEPLLGFVDVEPVASDFAITPLSTLASALMPLFAHDPEATLDDAVQNALDATGNLFGLAGVGTLVPADLTAGPVAPGPSADAGALVAGIAELADGAGVATTAMIRALASDASDARLDGLAFGVPVPLGAGTLAPSAGTTDLALAIGTFLAGPRNASGLGPADTLVDDALAASSGALDQPIQVRALVDGYGETNASVAATLRAKSLPAAPRVLIEAQALAITSQTAQELGFDVPAGLALGRHDLLIEDAGTGLRTRLRRAIEVFDPAAMPTVDRIAPGTGALVGGTLLRIRGTNLGPATDVRIDGEPVGRVSADFPRSIVVVTPPHAAGAVDVVVRNGTLVTTAAGAFEYRVEDARSNANVPSATAAIVFGAFRLFQDAADGASAQILSGRSTFTSRDQGSFSLDDLRSTQAVPAIVARDRSGTTLQASESLGKAFVLSDTTNGLTDFVRGSTSEENGVSLGATAFGPACFFPEPSDVRPDALARSYWLDGIEVDLARGHVRQKTGWLELDEDLAGSANLLVHGRDLGGAAADVGAERWGLAWTLEPNGTFHGLRTIDGDEQTLTGRFSQDADLGFLVLRGAGGADGTLGYYLVTPLESGVESAAFGNWSGGFVRHELADDGLGGQESAYTSGLERRLVGGAGPERAELAFRRATRRTVSKPASAFSEDVSASALTVTPSGRVFAGDDLVAYVNPSGGILLALGAFPDESAFVGDTGKALGLGAALFRDARKSYLSLEPELAQVALEAEFQELGATHAQAIGTDLFHLTLDPNTRPTAQGVSVPLCGTIPTLEAGTLLGVHKSTARDTTGAIASTRGAPPPWRAEVGYTFVDDELELFATRTTQPGGRFDGAAFPRWLASGTLANDGEVASLRGSDEFLGDTLMFLVADRQVALDPPVLDRTALALAYAPAATSSVRSSRIDLAFSVGGDVATTTVSQTKSEGGAFTSASSAGLGHVSAPSGQQFRLTVPNGAAPASEWQTFWTPSADAFFGIDDTPAVDGAGIVLGIERAQAGGSFVDDDRTLIGIELDPELSRATTDQLQLAPRSGSILSGETLTSRCDAGHALLGAELFAPVNATDLGAGAARVPFIGQIPVLDFLFSARDQAAGHGSLTVLITPRVLHSLDR